MFESNEAMTDRPSFFEYDNLIYINLPDDIIEIDPRHVAIFTNADDERRGADSFLWDPCPEDECVEPRIFWRGKVDHDFGFGKYAELVDLLELFGAYAGPESTQDLPPELEQDYEAHLNRMFDILGKQLRSRGGLVALSPFQEINLDMIMKEQIVGWKKTSAQASSNIIATHPETKDKEDQLLAVRGDDFIKSCCVHEAFVQRGEVL